MLREFVWAALLVLASGAAFAQTGDSGPAFEVASVKAAAPQAPGRMMMGRRGGPGTPDPLQVTYTNVNMRFLLQEAYNVKSYQISGPGWLDTERFDISAKIAPGASKEQFQGMIQNLLKERFKLALHHETKDMPVFALVVAKNGPKLKESVNEPAPATDAPPAGGPSSVLPAPPPPGGAGPALGGRMPVGKDGFPQMPRGGRGMMIMMNGSRFRLAGNQQTMGDLSNILAMQLDRPVLDQTGLAGKYDITLDFAPDPGSGPMAKMGMMMPHPPGADGGGGPAGPPPDQEAGPSIYTALQEQLGLKLEQKKGPVDLVVVDKGEKVPTEN